MKTFKDALRAVAPASNGSVTHLKCDQPLFTAEWYRKRADEVRYNGETVSRYNYFIAIAEAIERTKLEMESNV